MNVEDTTGRESDREPDERRKSITEQTASAVAQEYVDALTNDPREVQEWLGEKNLSYVGLIGIGVIMVQPFLAAPSLDLSATISVIAFALAIPLLAALVLLNRQEAFRRRFAHSALVTAGQAMGQGSAVVGVVAGFWHIHWAAGAVMLASGFLAMGVHSAGFMSVEPDLGPVAEAGKDHG